MPLCHLPQNHDGLTKEHKEPIRNPATHQDRSGVSEIFEHSKILQDSKSWNKCGGRRGLGHAWSVVFRPLAIGGLHFFETLCTLVSSPFFIFSSSTVQARFCTLALTCQVDRTWVPGEALAWNSWQNAAHGSWWYFEFYINLFRNVSKLIKIALPHSFLAAQIALVISCVVKYPSIRSLDLSCCSSQKMVEMCWDYWWLMWMSKRIDVTSCCLRMFSADLHRGKNFREKRCDSATP